jgi:hypothetical protein
MLRPSPLPVPRTSTSDLDYQRERNAAETVPTCTNDSKSTEYYGFPGLLGWSQRDRHRGLPKCVRGSSQNHHQAELSQRAILWDLCLDFRGRVYRLEGRVATIF